MYEQHYINARDPKVARAQRSSSFFKPFFPYTSQKYLEAGKIWMINILIILCVLHLKLALLFFQKGKQKREAKTLPIFK